MTYSCIKPIHPGQTEAYLSKGSLLRFKHLQAQTIYEFGEFLQRLIAVTIKRVFLNISTFQPVPLILQAEVQPGYRALNHEVLCLGSCSLQQLLDCGLLTCGIFLKGLQQGTWEQLARQEASINCT